MIASGIRIVGRNGLGNNGGFDFEPTFEYYWKFLVVLWEPQCWKPFTEKIE
ncbi:hypothetical protein RchiOBHm_Chr2g0133231 [Rosa chinensis]|uniref:Uncharacterized protein n=1 Tax=Rosa chinensis TaxID=74649 RepID=A0A2P6RVI8_ROSCH|nr:hypothetical protein RchiOBHm_Chr2g0133231 [Rosa chinensis]